MGLFNLVAMIASLMVLAMFVVLSPDKSWGATLITSIVIFALSVGFVFYAPSVVSKKQGGSDAAKMASLGPLSVITGVLLLLTAGAFAFAIFGMDKLAWAIDILAIGIFIIGRLMLRAATDVIGNVAAQYSAPSKHIKWQGEIQNLSSITSDGSAKNLLEKLAEKLRYAASDMPGGSPQDSQIGEVINALGEQLSADSGSSNVQSHISKIEMLIAQRDGFLRTARSKA